MPYWITVQKADEKEVLQMCVEDVKKSIEKEHEEQKEEEKFLKEKYPAVKKAFEHYSLILKMAKSGEL